MIALICLSGNTFAQEGGAAIVRLGDNFVERFEDRGRVRGDIIMGAMLGALNAEDLPDVMPRSSGHVMVAALPARADLTTPRDFCVRLSSKDGRFEAENTYRIRHTEPLPGGPFPYEGAYDEEVKEMAVVTTVSDGACGNRVETVIPTTWADGLPDGHDIALHLFVNAAGNAAFVEVGSAEAITCQDVTDENTLKYTASCRITPATLDANRTGDGRVPMNIVVSRMLGEDVFPISIYWPKPES